VRKTLVCGLAMLLSAGAAAAAEAPGRLIRETWEAAYLAGGKAGHVHTTVRALERDGRPLVVTTVNLNLTVKHFRDTVNLRMETVCEETPAGKVVGVSMRQYQGGTTQLDLRGTVEGDHLHVQVDGGRRLDKRVAWSDQVVGLAGQERLFRERRVKPQDRFTYLAYEPTVTAVVTMRVAVKDFQDVEVPGGRARQRLLRVEAVPDRIAGHQLPSVMRWLDAELTPVRSQTELPGIGTLTLQRTTAEAALHSGGPTVALTNIGTSALIPTQRIRRPYDTEAAVYRITVRGDTDPATAFEHDGRQEIRSVRGATVELHVRARRQPGPERGEREPGPEFLQSCYFINSADAQVRAFARQAVGAETDPWRKALRIESWVHGHMRKQTRPEAFAPADQVARTLEGDCTEYAVLTAAMCRAAGVPARAAVGLVYVDSVRGPAFGFHMWAEVWVRGGWMPVDATLGRGYVGATHLKISDHSWAETRSLTPLLPAMRLLGKAAIEVVRTSPGE
jgi:transglutaminase-like putative cysteine protease